MPFAALAHLVEHSTCNGKVIGSRPIGGSIGIAKALILMEG